jgi:hypothetical protein
MKTQITLLTLLAAVTLLSVGCQTAVISPGTKTTGIYRLGKLTSTIPGNITTSYKAAEAAMQELGLSVIQRVKDQLEARIIARDAQDNKIVVSLISVTDETTKLTINVGSLSKARRIYQAVLDNMPKA